MQLCDALMRAGDMARTGKFSNWWTIWARLRIGQCSDHDLDWTEQERQWLDFLCDEAKGLPTATAVVSRDYLE
jgi:hypothetical protein